MTVAPDVLGARILVVDDQDANVLLLRRMLGAAGYTSVSFTTDPRVVCELHRKHHYDLILLDLLMPGMYGFQVIEGLKEIEEDGDLPVLVISAQPDYKKRAMQAGATEFITKPINRVELLGHVQKMLEVRLTGNAARTAKHAIEKEAQNRTAKLRDDEELYRELANSSPDALWIREIKGDLIHYVNPAWEKITGQSLAAGDLPEKVFAAIHPDHLARVRHEMEQMPEGGVDLECRIDAQGDVNRWVHLRTFPVMDSKQKIVRIAGTLQDISARKAGESGGA